MLKKMTTLITALATAATVAAADTPSFDAKVILEVLSSRTLSENQQKNFDQFKDPARYFGAFFFDPNGNTSYWTADYGSLNAARKSAENRCNTDAYPARCQIYAVTVPMGQDPEAPDLVGFSSVAAEVFFDEYRKEQREDRYGSFAMSQSGSYGYTWDWPSAEEAEASAVLFCESDMLKSLAKVYIAERKFSRDSGFTECKVAHTYMGKDFP